MQVHIYKKVHKLDKTRQMRKILSPLFPLNAFFHPRVNFSVLSSHKGKVEKNFSSANKSKKNHFSPNQDVLTENCSSRCCRQRIAIIIKGESKAESILTNTMCCNNENNFVIKLPSSRRIFILCSENCFLLSSYFVSVIKNFFIKTVGMLF